MPSPDAERSRRRILSRRLSHLSLAGIFVAWLLGGWFQELIRSSLRALRQVETVSPIEAASPEMAELCKAAAAVLPRTSVVGLLLPPGPADGLYWQLTAYMLAPRRVIPVQPKGPTPPSPYPRPEVLVVYRGIVPGRVLATVPAGTVVEVARGRRPGGPP